MTLTGEAGGRRILVVDDDERFAHLVQEYLSGEGDFDVHVRGSGEAGVAAILGARPFDAVVLDVNMPGMNGFEVLELVRRRSVVPVIMLTARGDNADRVLGLENGADDYVAKPCNLRELAARLRAVLRRVDHPNAALERIVVGDLALEPGSMSVLRDGEAVATTAAEYRVLETLTRSAGRVETKDAIGRQALGRGASHSDRSVDVHVARLRRKLGPLPDGRPRIKTVRGRGYLYVT